MQSLLFPPYVKVSDSYGITEEDWQEALDLWSSNLSIVLKSQESEFRNFVLENGSFRKFLETFLQARANFHESSSSNQVEEVAIEKRVLLVILRAMQRDLSLTDVTEANSLAEALYKNKFLSVPLLLDFLVIYAKSNRVHAQQVFSNAIELAPDLLNDFQHYSGLVLDHIKAIHEKIDNIKDRVEEAVSDIINGDAEDIKTYLNYMVDVAISLDCLFSVSKEVANIFYNLGVSEVEKNLVMIVKEFYDSCIPKISYILNSKSSSKESKRALNILKHALVSLIYHAFDAIFFDPLGFTAEEENPLLFIASNHRLDDIRRMHETVEQMCNTLSLIIEQSVLDKPVESFVDAPLILDLEVEYNLSGKLTKIKDDVLNGKDIRIDDVNKSLETMRNMVQESPTRLKKSERKKLRALLVNGSKEKGYEKGYLQEDDEARWASLISQVLDVFPELGKGFIEACLISLNGEPETVIDRLLEDTLSENLSKLDRSMSSLPPELSFSIEKDSFGSGPTEDSPLANRRNIFDNDEFDVFSGKKLDLSRVNKGKKDRGTAESLLDDKSFVEAYKEAIIESAYNIYEDEYDDTYDT